MWRSPEAHLHGVQGVVGSNPITPTISLIPHLGLGAANDDLGAQVAADKFQATARTASPDEKSALWALMTGIYPPYDEYQAATEREIPVVILERAG